MRRSVLLLVAGLLVGIGLTLAVDHLSTRGPASSQASVWRPDAGYWPYPNKIDWTQQRPGLQQEIDKAGDTSDCGTLLKLMNQQMESSTSGPEMWTYIDRWGRHDRCQEFLREDVPSE